VGSIQCISALVEALGVVSVEIKNGSFETSQHGHGLGQYAASPSGRSANLIGRLASCLGGRWFLDVFLFRPSQDLQNL